jgi:hypothetical protein
VSAGHEREHQERYGTPFPLAPEHSSEFPL